MCGPRCGDEFDSRPMQTHIAPMLSKRDQFQKQLFADSSYLNIVVPPNSNWENRAQAIGLNDVAGNALSQANQGNYFKVTCGDRAFLYEKQAALQVAQDVLKGNVSASQEPQVKAGSDNQEVKIKALCNIIGNLGERIHGYILGQKQLGLEFQSPKGVELARKAREDAESSLVTNILTLPSRVDEEKVKSSDALLWMAALGQDRQVFQTELSTLEYVKALEKYRGHLIGYGTVLKQDPSKFQNDINAVEALEKAINKELNVIKFWSMAPMAKIETIDSDLGKAMHEVDLQFSLKSDKGVPIGNPGIAIGELQVLLEARENEIKKLRELIPLIAENDVNVLEKSVQVTPKKVEEYYKKLLTYLNKDQNEILTALKKGSVRKTKPAFLFGTKPLTIKEVGDELRPIVTTIIGLSNQNVQSLLDSKQIIQLLRTTRMTEDVFGRDVWTEVLTPLKLSQDHIRKFESFN